MSHNIDHIFYINLDHRKDRKEQIENELEKMGLKDKSERFNAIYRKPGSVGCGLSHLEILKLAKERKYKNVLILEDDFEFLVNKDTFEENCRLFFENIKEYNVCMFSYNCQRQRDTKYHFIKKTVEAQTTSGYLVNENFYDRLINNFTEAIDKLSKTSRETLYSIDIHWKRLQNVVLWYHFYPRIGKQRSSYSDILNSHVDYKV